MARATKIVRVATRGSSLALCQTTEVLDQLRLLNPSTEFQVVTIKTGGDSAPNAPLASLGKAVFVKELEVAILDGKADIAVHSLKDMPTQLPEGLTIGAVCSRVDPRDVLVNRWDCSLEELPAGARIGTSSPRRMAQLRSLRSDLNVLPIRGNVDTRLEKAGGEDYDGVILAAAGVIRMGLQDKVSQFLSTEEFVPAPGQGALALEICRDNTEILSMVSGIEDTSTRLSVTAERAFLENLGDGCQIPLGAYALGHGDTMMLTVFIASIEGDQVFRTTVMGRSCNPHEIVIKARQQLVESGASALLS